MKWQYVFCSLIVAFTTPAVANDTDQNLKQEVEKIGAAYADSFNKHDGAGIAGLFATGGMHVNPAGPRTDIASFYEGAFKAGLDHEEITVDQVWPLGSDTLLAMGQYRITGKNQSGAPHRDRWHLDFNGYSRRRQVENQDAICHAETTSPAPEVKT